MEGSSVIEGIERIGGWAVVVWIVWWLTKRWEAQMAAMIATMNKTIEAIAKHDVAAKERHDQLKDRLDKLYQRGA